MVTISIDGIVIELRAVRLRLCPEFYQAGVRFAIADATWHGMGMFGIVKQKARETILVGLMDCPGIVPRDQDGGIWVLAPGVTVMSIETAADRISACLSMS